MKKLAVSPAINPHALTPEAKETLTDELYRVQSEVFSGVDREGFYNYVIAPKTYKTRIYKFQNRQKETVGYITFHVYETRIPKAGKLKTVYVIRTETGVLKAYRGRTPLFPILFRESFKFWFGKGMPEAYFMATPIHPVPFVLAQRGFGELYPRPGVETPEHILRLKESLIASLGLEQAGGAGNPIVKVGWIVKQTEAQRIRWEKSKDPDAQYYLSLNPGYAKGNGVMILSPGRISNFWKSTWRWIKRTLKPRFQRSIVARRIAKATTPQPEVGAPGRKRLGVVQPA